MKHQKATGKIPTLCVNGDGRPICPPSKVLCRECLDKLSNKMQEILNHFEIRKLVESYKEDPKEDDIRGRNRK